MRILLFTLSLCTMLAMSSFQSTQAQSTQKKKETKEQRTEQRKKSRAERQAKNAEKTVASIESLNFSFYPNSVTPEFGAQIELFDGDPYFTVNKNSLYMDLPYVGRFYITPVSPESKSINIISSKFLYFVHTDDETTFDVTIIPSDLVQLVNQGIKFVFSINKKTQQATLTVTADNRQEVSYQGSIQ